MNKNLRKTPDENREAVVKTVIVSNFWTLNENTTSTHNLGRCKPEVKRAGVSTYGTTVL